MKCCRECGDELVVGKNRTEGKAKRNRHICKKCTAAYNKKYREIHREHLAVAAKAYREDNKECHAAQKKVWWDTHPEQRVGAYLKRKYGITLADYDAMYEAQGGVCAISGCNKAVADNLGRRLAVDHDHETGRVRGLLCSAHNTAMGLCHDSPMELRALANYLEG